MENRLNEAAKTGSVEELLELLQEDALVLDRVMVAYSFPENPLHIAAMFAHADFAREVLSRKPEFARELNSHGSSPLHLASANGHVEFVREILKIDPDVCCLIHDRMGNIPLHVAVIKGRIEIINEFIHLKPELAREITCRGETVLHLCVIYNQFETFKCFVDDDELLNAKDDEGNTVLHLAAAKRQIQMIKFLIDIDKRSVEVNALNANGFTALDVLLLCPAQSGDLLIGEMLRSAGALRAANMSPFSSSHHEIVTNNREQTCWPSTQMITATRLKNKKDEMSKKKVDGSNLRRDANTLMVVAILIATMTFEAGLNPPGGDCAKFNAKYCTLTEVNTYSIHGNNTALSTSLDYHMFELIDTVGFLSSLSAIVLIIIGFPFDKRYLMWGLMVIMMIAITSVAILFTFWMAAINPDYPGNNRRLQPRLPLIWQGLIGLICLWQLVRVVIWLFKKYGKKKKGQASREIK